MLTIFKATEADEGMGHVAPWRGFAQLALQQNYRVHMAAPHLGQLEKLMGSTLGHHLWQAPSMRPASNPDTASPKSWSELLVSLGYADADAVSGAVKAWGNILKASRADVVIADYAPALQLAARVLDIPVIEAGGGFCVPPLDPAQCFPGVQSHDVAISHAAGMRLTMAFNDALQRSGCQHLLRDFSDLASSAAQRVVLSPAELDHYGPRVDITYVGLPGLGSPAVQGVAKPSTGNDLPVTVIGYLKANTPGLSELIEKLAMATIDAHLYIPGSQPSMGVGSVKVVNQPIDLSAALPLADIYLSNGGLHGVGQALHHGCRPMLVPMQAEQVAMARSLVRMKWGSVYLPASGLPLVDFNQLFQFRRASSSYLTWPDPPAETALLSLVKRLLTCSPAKTTELAAS